VKTLELRRPREVGDLFRDAWAVFRSHAGLFIMLSAAVAIPAGLIVEGIGQGMLTNSYDSSPSPLDQLIPAFVRLVVVGPIITAICIYALREVAVSQPPAAGQVLVAGFEAFTPLFAVAFAPLFAVAFTPFLAGGFAPISALRACVARARTRARRQPSAY